MNKKQRIIYGHLGGFIGALGWLLGLLVAAMISGDWVPFSKIFIPGLVVSISLWIGTAFIFELIRKHYEIQTAMRIGGGMLFQFLGIIILLNNHWWAEIVEESEAFMDLNNTMSGVYKTPDLVPLMLLIVSVGLIGSGAYRILGKR